MRANSFCFFSFMWHYICLTQLPSHKLKFAVETSLKFYRANPEISHLVMAVASVSVKLLAVQIELYGFMCPPLLPLGRSKCIGECYKCFNDSNEVC